MPNLIMSKLKEQDYDKAVKAKIMTFLMKLTADDTAPGLHVEKMNNPVDDRVRTARVDQGLRAVLYLLEPIGQERTYVYAGTWGHDEAIKRARTRRYQMNPVSGIAEVIVVNAPDEAVEAVPAPRAGTTRAPAQSLLATRGYLITDLTDGFGFPADIAARAFEATSEKELLGYAEMLENSWQEEVLLGMAVGQTVSQIKESLGISIDVSGRPAEDGLSEDDRLLESLKHPAAQMQFTFIDNDAELRRVIEDGDFGAWRVFLHPEQRRYATSTYNGPARLTGGAGTGKTVVLLHRARMLAKANPEARIILTTFTRALAENLRRDLERLDPDIRIARGLDEAGVFVAGVDQIAAAARQRAQADFGAAAERVLGARIESRLTPVRNDVGWEEAIGETSPTLPQHLQNRSFFTAEYLQVILPNQITTRNEYFTVHRAGRGVALDRKKRAEVWKVVEQQRKNARISGTISYAEIAAVSGCWLTGQVAATGHALEDHVLIDEAQDLTPAHWRLMRAIVAPGVNDIFIAEDTHQRIYGQHVLLSRYEIRIVGRSRRLTLNYRTTEQNLRYALAVLEGGEYLDSTNEVDGTSGYRSARRGPHPRVVSSSSDSAQLDSVAIIVREWLASGVKPETIAILANTNNKAKNVQDALAGHGISTSLLKSARQSGNQPVVLTMHTAKGMEFSRVILYDVSEGAFPNPFALKDVAPEELPDVLLRERSLLYVAASRARDELVVTWKGAPSPLLRG